MKKSFLLCATAVLLTACGGGGSGDTPNTAPTPTKTVLDNTGLTIEKNSTPIGKVEGIGLQSNGKKIATLSGHNRRYSFNGALVKNPDVGEIAINGATIQLLKGAANLVTVGSLDGIVLSKALTTAYTASKDPTRDIFYFGLETASANMPKVGIATYQGNASRYDNVSGKVKNIGTSTLVADFGQKKISGELAIDGILRRNISLKEADIRGNSFKGRATAGENHILTRTVEGRYEGKFYGPNAEEVAGKATFQGEAIIGQLESLNTSFSAERGAIR